MWWIPIAVAAEPTTAALACAGRKPCVRASVHDAGHDAAGDRLEVVEIALTAADPEAGRAAAIGADSCTPYEWHLYRFHDGAVADHRLLATLCNNGYGAAGIGGDSFEVGDNLFTQSTTGGSSWRSSSSTTSRLSPFEVLAGQHIGYWSAASNQDETRFDLRTFSASGTFQVPRCGRESEDVEGWSWSGIPVVSAPGFATSDWRTAALGDCAVRVDASGAGGFVVHGPRSAAADASLAVVSPADGVLVLELRDDHLVKMAEPWTREDHVELWFGPRFDHTDHCVDEVGGAVQYAVPVDDAPAIRVGDHGPPPPTVERVWVGDVLRMRLTLPEGLGRPKEPSAWEWVTVVYSDSDDGHGQERLIATSQLVHGDGRTLGRWWWTRRECRVEGGVLVH